MLDLKIDPTTYDLEITEPSGQIATVEDLEEVRQRVMVALKTHQGEWTFNMDLGLPWREEILTKPVNLEAIDARLRGLVMSVQDVTSVDKLDLTLDRVNRRLTVDLHVNTVFGNTETSVVL
jgi:hypothetical protein